MSFGITAGAWLAAGATAGGAYLNGRSAKKASKAQAQAANNASAQTLQSEREARAYQERMDTQARADREPWRAAGANALTQMTQRMQPGGDLMRDFGMPDFQKDPGYDFRMAEGQKGLNNSMASRGMALSGAALKAAVSYNQNFASNEYGNAFARYKGNQDGQYNKLASLAGVGQIAANQNGSGAAQLGGNVGQGMMNAGQTVGNNMMGAGNARASGYIAQGNALVDGMNQGVSLWNQRDKPQGPGAQNIPPRPWSA